MNDLSHPFLERVSRLVARTILRNTGQIVDVPFDRALLEDGSIDSMGMVELVLELRNEFDVELDIVDLTQENFGSVRAIAGLIARRSPDAVQGVSE